MEIKDVDTQLYFNTKCFDACVDSFKSKMLTAVEKECLGSCLGNLRSLQIEFVNGRRKYQQQFSNGDPK